MFVVTDIGSDHLDFHVEANPGSGMRFAHTFRLELRHSNVRRGEDVRRGFYDDALGVYGAHEGGSVVHVKGGSIQALMWHARLSELARVLSACTNMLDSGAVTCILALQRYNVTRVACACH